MKPTLEFVTTLIASVHMALILGSCTHARNQDSPAIIQLQPCLPLPCVMDNKPKHYESLHQVVAFTLHVYSGAAPRSDKAFEELRDLGFKTILSVDGALPDVDMAKRYGLRYVHLPISYGEMETTRKMEITRAVRDLQPNGMVYIHCHHGKHRSASAAASALVSLGELTPGQAVARMKVSECSERYSGLYKNVIDSNKIDDALLRNVDGTFPEQSITTGFVQSMVEIDGITDLLKVIESAGWQVPADHPDLVPIAEAGRMADMFRNLKDDEGVKSKPHSFQAFLAESATRSQALEDALAASQTPEVLSTLWKSTLQSCNDCHKKYRD